MTACSNHGFVLSITADILFCGCWGRTPSSEGMLLDVWGWSNHNSTVSVDGEAGIVLEGSTVAALGRWRVAVRCPANSETWRSNIGEVGCPAEQ